MKNGMYGKKSAKGGNGGKMVKTPMNIPKKMNSK